MSRFNLIDEKWIPVRFPDGRREELCLCDVLLRAAEISAIEDGSPLVVASLHRFLLAVLYRALEAPTDHLWAKKIFQNGFPPEVISGYFEKWRNRFWLFDEKYPFGQNPCVPCKEIEPWTKLTAEHNATTNKVLFDHTNTKAPGERTPAECARWIIATMTFSIAGGRGYFPSPSANGMMCLPVGRSLQETLCYNLVPQGRAIAGDDLPIWERDPRSIPLSVPKRHSDGIADLYTWQSRMILLEETGNGFISRIRFVAGEGYDRGQLLDPMTPHRVDKDKGILQVGFNGRRGIWREFDSLLPDKDDDRLAPSTIQHAIRLADGKPERLPLAVLVLGLKYQPPNANVDFWRMERFVLPNALASNRYVRSEIHEILKIAEDTQKALWSACRSFARDRVGRGTREPDKGDLSSFVEQMPCIPRYWATLEARFHKILQAYTLERDPDEIEIEWREAVQDALVDAWEQFVSSVSAGDAWTIRALVKAEWIVLKEKWKAGAIIAEFRKSMDKEEA